MLVTRQSNSVIKVVVVYMGILISKCLKEELAWAIDKEISTVIPLNHGAIPLNS